MHLFIVTIAVQVHDDGHQEFYLAENAGGTLATVAILQREISLLEEEWKKAHPTPEDHSGESGQ